MATATHKLSAASITITSGLSVDQLKSLSSQAATETVPTGRHRGAKARIRPNGADASAQQNYKIGTETRSMMTFSVSFNNIDGGSKARSRIESFKTMQDTFLGFIPAGPKELLGWNWYQNFMQNFGQMVRAADPSAQIHIIEQAEGS